MIERRNATMFTSLSTSQVKDHNKHKCLAFVAVLLSMLLADQSYAQAQLSVGPKASYRFGSGWEGGFELSYIPDIVNPQKGFYGFTFDIIPTGKTKSVHLGGEVMAIMGGVDLGPTFFWGSDLCLLRFFRHSVYWRGHLSVL